MSGYRIALTGLTKSFGRVRALDQVSVELPADGIYGLLGRNGSGKSTLLAVLAGLSRATAGRARLDDIDVFDNPVVRQQICIIRESADLLFRETIETNFAYLSRLRVNWRPERAAELLEAFGLSPRLRVSRLSRGQRSAVGAVIGLATAARLTLLDEVHLGMDAPSRQLFYDELLAEAVQTPRTFIISSHLISEVEPLIERAIVLDQGKLLLCEEVDSLRTNGFSITGPAHAVETLCAGMTVIGRRDLGPTREMMVLREADVSLTMRARQNDCEIGALRLQELVTALTSTGHRQAS